MKIGARPSIKLRFSVSLCILKNSKFGLVHFDGLIKLSDMDINSPLFVVGEGSERDYEKGYDGAGTSDDEEGVDDDHRSGPKYNVKYVEEDGKRVMR